jgi:signal transduction histidine kinase
MEFVRCCDETPNVREVMRVLDAIERVQAAVERDLARSFKDRLAGPAGLDLLIEVAHDLRSPLTSILFLSETLRAGEGGRLEPAQERQLALIYTAAFELSSLANDLTELARGGEELLERVPVTYSIGSVLQSVRDIALPVAEERGLELRIEHDAADRRAGHPAALGRVLLNLVTNALRCTMEGFVEVKTQERPAEVVEFSIRDTGPGIPDSVIAALFEPFYPNTSPRAHGFSTSGLGLAICRRLVQTMGGELKVRSALGKGSCFFFELRMPHAPGELPLAEISATR